MTNFDYFKRGFKSALPFYNYGAFDWEAFGEWCCVVTVVLGIIGLGVSLTGAVVSIIS